MWETRELMQPCLITTGGDEELPFFTYMSPIWLFMGEKKGENTVSHEMVKSFGLFCFPNKSSRGLLTRHL